jgi:hypothetical protein
MLDMYVQDQIMVRRRTSFRGAPSPQARERLLAKLPDMREILRGSLVTRYRRCGRPGCHCAAEGDPGHGPAYYLMVTTGPGETVQIYVPARVKREVEAWLDNFRRARDTLEQISSINRELLRQGKLFEGGD